MELERSVCVCVCIDACDVYVFCYPNKGCVKVRGVYVAVGVVCLFVCLFVTCGAGISAGARWCGDAARCGET